MEQSPFIKKFKTKNRCYIYDVNTNDLLGVNRTVYDIIDEIHETGAEEIVEKFKHIFEPHTIRENYDLIKRMEKEKDYFSTRRPEITSGIDSVDTALSALQSGLKQIVLELTDRCNHRCGYCSFSGKYAHSRTHGKNDMTFETAKKALDFFIERASEIAENMGIAITYYGGEPLLSFDLLKRTVDYTLDTYKNKKIRFSFTTNGTLLDRKSVIDYLVKNDIRILVSLDGPKQIHDRYRLFKNKKPTFDQIMGNLIFIKKKYPEYFERKISINAVLAPPFDIEAVTDFFFKNDFFNELQGKIKISSVDPVDTTFFKDYHMESEMKKMKSISRGLLKQYKKALINDTFDELTIEKELFRANFFNIASRKTYPLDELFPPMGACFPGRRKLFVDTEGRFYMCEKVRGNFEIGDVDTGFDYKKIFKFYQEYDRFFSRCSECWALRLCNKCFNSVRKGEQLDVDRREEFCLNMKKTIERDLTIFCEIIERNPDAFKVYKNVQIS